MKPLKLNRNDHKDLISQLEERADRGNKMRSVSDHQARVNTAFYRGYQWLVADSRTGTNTLRRVIHEPDDPASPLLLKANLIAGHVDWLVSRMTKSNPVPECRPTSDDPDDISAARVGTRILASEAERVGLETLITELYAWVVPCGWAYFQVTWDPDDGDFVAEDSKGGKDIHLGNVKVEVVPHFELVVDPNAASISKARWCIRTVAMTPEEVYEKWGKEVEGDKVRTLQDELAMLGDTMGSFKDTEKVAVRQFWLKKGANRSAPEGMVFTWCGKTVLEAPKEFPYEHNHLPFAQFNYLPPLGDGHGRTPITDLVDVQQVYNTAWSKEVDYMQRMVPKMLSPQGAIDPEMMQPRLEVIEYQPVGQPPEWLIPDAGWMAQFENTMTRCELIMADRTGRNEAAKGGLAGTSAAATAIALQEAAAEPLGVPAKELARGLSETGWQHLMLVRQYWEEKRVVRTWSAAGELEVTRFSKADLNHRLDCHVTTESALPRSKTGRAQMLIELWREGVFNDPRVLMRGMDLPATDVLAQSFDVDVRQAERENGTLLKARLRITGVDPMTGEPQVDVQNIPAVDDWHNHEVHVAVHNEFRKGKEFEELSEQVKTAFEAHVQAHMTIISQKMASEQDMQAMQGGSPPKPNGQGPSVRQPTEAETAGGQEQGPPMNPSTFRGMAGIGGPGNPGQVPGIDPDLQAERMGS